MTSNIDNPEDNLEQTKSHEAFMHFMENMSKCTILFSGERSFIIRCDLKPKVISKYTATRSNNFNIPIKQLLIKVVLHGEENERGETVILPKNLYTEDDENFTPQWELPVVNRQKTIKTTIEELKHEIKVQNYLYEQSYRDELTPCEPMCPRIVHSIFNIQPELIDTIANYMIKTVQPNSHQVLWKKKYGYDPIQQSPYFLNKWFLNNKLSFIVMELLDEFKPLPHYGSLLKNWGKDGELYVRRASWEYARMCASYGVLHGNSDNLNNVLVKRGKTIIIDFSESRVDETELSKINTTPDKMPMFVDDQEVGRVLQCKPGVRSIQNVKDYSFYMLDYASKKKKYEIINDITKECQKSAKKFFKEFKRKFQNTTFKDQCDIIFIKQEQSGGKKIVKIYKTSTRKNNSKNKNKSKSTSKNKNKNKNKNKSTSKNKSTCKNKNKNKNKNN
jgi:hypothetical protein